MAGDSPHGFTRTFQEEAFKAFGSSKGLFELLGSLVPIWAPDGSQMPWTEQLKNQSDTEE